MKMTVKSESSLSFWWLIFSGNQTSSSSGHRLAIWYLSNKKCPCLLSIWNDGAVWGCKQQSCRPECEKTRFAWAPERPSECDLLVLWLTAKTLGCFSPPGPADTKRWRSSRARTSRWPTTSVESPSPTGPQSKGGLSHWVSSRSCWPRKGVTGRDMHVFFDSHWSPLHWWEIRTLV